MRRIGHAALRHATAVREAQGKNADLARVYADRPWAAEQGRRLHQALTGPGQAGGRPVMEQERCPAPRLAELLDNLRETVASIQRNGPPGPSFTWSHVVCPVVWLSLPFHRAALVNEWASLRLPLQPLESLAGWDEATWAHEYHSLVCLAIHPHCPQR